jgi:hypothetical protein
VRAGSALNYFGDELAVIQDDANFLALIATDPFRVRAVPFARGEGGKRLFDDARGNKADKLDLEACVTATLGGRPALVAFGSGSTRERERVVVATLSQNAFTTRILPLPGLYRALHGHAEFSGAQLNVEGALLSDQQLLLLQRGNAKGRGEQPARDAVASLSWDELVACISEAPAREPALLAVTAYELGELGGVRLTFTDACAIRSGAILYLSTAEASPDAVRDGPVQGSVIGISDGSIARCAPLQDAQGADVMDKPEGIVLHRARPRHALVVLDPDDPARPSELCEVALSGPWWD